MSQSHAQSAVNIQSRIERPLSSKGAGVGPANGATSLMHARDALALPAMHKLSGGDMLVAHAGRMGC